MKQMQIPLKTAWVPPSKDTIVKIELDDDTEFDSTWNIAIFNINAPMQVMFINDRLSDVLPDHFTIEEPLVLPLLSNCKIKLIEGTEFQMCACKDYYTSKLGNKICIAKHFYLHGGIVRLKTLTRF